VFRGDGVRHLSSWVAVPTLDGTLPLTGAGIAVGASVDDLRAAYGEDLFLSARPDECEGSWTFSVFGRLITIESPHIRGTLSGPPQDPGTRVRSMAAGQGSSC
jgi:hypothetical protein